MTSEKLAVPSRRVDITSNAEGTKVDTVFKGHFERGKPAEGPAYPMTYESGHK